MVSCWIPSLLEPFVFIPSIGGNRREISNIDFLTKTVGKSYRMASRLATFVVSAHLQPPQRWRKVRNSQKRRAAVFQISFIGPRIPAERFSKMADVVKGETP
jgi:hypothetical protein